MTAARTTRSTLGSLGCLRPQAGAAVRLVCFPHAGGVPGTFRRWPAALGSAVEVWTATLPGRGARAGEPFATSWAELVADLADATEPRPGDTALALLGHSFGALVAYEVAREHERRGVGGPCHLFVSGCQAPQRFDERWPLPVDDDELVSEVDRRFGAVPAAVWAEPDLLARFVPILRADLELAGDYRWVPGPELSTPITALAGAGDRAGSPNELRHWRKLTRGEFRAATLPGAHFSIHEELRDVARIIRQAVTARRA